jgi:hypothetical protein
MKWKLLGLQLLIFLSLIAWLSLIPGKLQGFVMGGLAGFTLSGMSRWFAEYIFEQLGETP